MRLFAGALWFVLCGSCAFATGVWKVSASGVPYTWRGGVVQYWTDQGDLSATITGPQADAALQWAFSQWSSVQTAALQAVAAGKLAEDVTTANTDVGSGQLVVPPDAQAANGGERLIVIYDYDGSITDALRGVGASDVSAFATNAATYWVDAYANDGYFAHAVLLLNGNCFASLNQLKWTLLRVTGRLLGLGWSQANDNPTTSADYMGWPAMHPVDGWCMSNCFPDMRLRVDDVAAVSRLYPVTQANAVQWPGKTLFRETTGAISGHVLFADGSAMAGVNVVARLVDPVTGARSRAYVVTCVSGYLHGGRPGSGITGWVDAMGVRYDAFGTKDAAMAGYYSLDGLPVPYGAATKYEVTVEAVNPLYTGDYAVGPYEVAQVSPSGSAVATVVTVGAGATATLDITMQGSARSARLTTASAGNAWGVPASGVWSSQVVGGAADYLAFRARSDRSFTIEVTALDEQRRATTQKMIPAIGVWDQATNAAAALPDVVSANFNSSLSGTTQLVANTTSDDLLLFAVGDTRGEARADFAYRARVFYADTLETSRGAVTVTLRITGYGFTPSTSVTLSGLSASVLSVSANRVVASVARPGDGTYDVVVSDDATGAVSTMFQALRVGDAGATVTLVSPPVTENVPQGATSPAMVFRVTDAFGDAIGGESVTLRATNGSTLSVCGASVCTVETNDAGEVGSGVLVESVGAVSVTATLWNGAVATGSVTGVSANAAVVPLNPGVWVEAGKSVMLPLAFAVEQGGTLKAASMLTLGSASAATNGVGVAQFLVSAIGMQAGGSGTYTACMQSSSTVCGTSVVTAVDASRETIQMVQGGEQTVVAGSGMVPVVVQVLDAAGNPVGLANVQTTVLAFRAGGAVQEVLRSSTATVSTGLDGTAVIAVPQAWTSSTLELQLSATLANGRSVTTTMKLRQSP